MSLIRKMLHLGPRRSSASAQAPAPPMAHERRVQRRLAPAQAFTPTQPKPGRRQIVGREAELKRILQALQEDRAHVVLYSERGRGKTSLSNMIAEALRRTDVIVARHTCDASSTFDSILHGLMRDLPPSLLALCGQGGLGEGCEAVLPNRELRPHDVVSLPSRLICRRLVCIVDEFDRVEDTVTRTRLADAIKQISDSDVDLLFVIVGVSENLDEILGQHPSIQRSVLGVHLPLFTDRDVAKLIAKGAQETGFTFFPTAIARITALALGMPYMAQLIGLRLTQAAAARGDTQVTKKDFGTAVARLLSDANGRVQRLYDSLTEAGKDAEMVLALRRVATAPQDLWGRFPVTVAGDGSASIGTRRISKECWTRLQAACLLKSCGSGTGLFTFAERALMHHVLLLAAHDITLLDDGANGEVSESAGRPAAQLHAIGSAL